MVDDKAAHLQSESNRLAAKLNAEPVKVGVLLDNDNLNIFNRRWRQVSLQLLGARADQTSTASARWMTSSIGSLRG